jgi:hypothetical protein
MTARIDLIFQSLTCLTCRPIHPIYSSIERTEALRKITRLPPTLLEVPRLREEGPIIHASSVLVYRHFGSK